MSVSLRNGSRTPPTAGRHEPEELLDAYLAAAGRGRRKLPPPAKAFSGIVSRTIVSVSSRITYVLGRLYKGRQVTCRTLYEASRSRSEMVATFLALLELIKDKRIWGRRRGGRPAGAHAAGG